MPPIAEKAALNRLRLGILTTIAGVAVTMWAWAPVQQFLDPRPVCGQCQGTGLEP